MKPARIFGQLADGQTVHAIVLSNGLLSVEVLTWGAVIRDVRLSGCDHPLVLGLNTIEDYLTHSRNFGATLGRCANRISGGRFSVGDETFHLDRNDPEGENCLHGGGTGMSRSLWRIADLASDHAVLEITDPDGNAGFPGLVDTRCAIHLDGRTLGLRYTSTCSQTTPVNIAHHGYFNLCAGDDICDHLVTVAADHYLQTNAEKIPFAAPSPVEGTDFDFRRAVVIGERIRSNGGFDHNFCLSSERRQLRPVAELSSPSGLSMEVLSTEAGLQLFTADRLNCPVPGLEGRRYHANAGICLETQIWPDAVNQPRFPEVLLHPGETRVQETRFRFF